jgi:hypothetical protein
VDGAFEDSRKIMPDNTTRRFSMTIATLGLLAVPIGCNSDAPAPTAPMVTAGDVAATQPASPPSTDPGTLGVLDPPAQKIDQDVRQTAGAVKEEAVDLKGGVTQAVGEAEKAAGQIKGDLEQATRDAKGRVRDARLGVKKAVEGARGEAKRRVKATEDDLKKSAEGALDNLLGNPK